ncbi:hypothetical protein L596_013324 [Steinernema carpocapsae]|uniref:Uncharacterized protein n=1 Tax=Steinernema carpocapsae TaxID=34508 RepID=A0A4U5P0N5_STECR|nr:hypothetical protein L596_013324 [Steinernema carpocapsae]
MNDHFETSDIDSVCVFRYEGERVRVFSALFGEIAWDKGRMACYPAANVAIRAFVKVDYQGPNVCHYTAVRFRCIEPDDAAIVIEAPWNKGRKARIAYDSDEESPFAESFNATSQERIRYKTSGKILDMKNPCEILVQCNAFRRNRERCVFGCVRREDLTKMSIGMSISMDIFYNDGTKGYVIHEYQLPA